MTDPSTDSRPPAVVDRQLEAHNDGDIDRFVDSFAPDAVIAPLGGSEPVAVGREEIYAEYGPLLDEYPSLRCETDSRIVVGDTVVLHERVLIDGEETTETIGIYRVVDGHITRLWLADA